MFGQRNSQDSGANGNGGNPNGNPPPNNGNGGNPNGNPPPNNGNGGNPNGNPPPANGTEKAKGFAYRCAEACTFKGKFYREGDTIVLPEKREVPHFKFAGEKETAGE